MSGVTVETAIRIMSRFKQSRLVSGTAKHIVIRDLIKLKQLASSHS
jgi:CRP-like cAMP-binding protein